MLNSAVSIAALRENHRTKEAVGRPRSHVLISHAADKHSFISYSFSYLKSLTGALHMMNDYSHSQERAITSEEYAPALRHSAAMSRW